jgi:hypothetical protein
MKALANPSRKNQHVDEGQCFEHELRGSVNEEPDESHRICFVAVTFFICRAARDAGSGWRIG